MKLAVPGLSVVDLDPQRASFLTEHLAQRLSDQGAEVVSAQDLSVMLGLDRQRQLMGCTVALFGPGPVGPQVAVGRDQVSLGFAGELPW